MASKKIEPQIATGIVKIHAFREVNSVFRIGGGKVLQLTGREIKPHIQVVAQHMGVSVQEVGRKLKKDGWISLPKRAFTPTSK